MARYEGSKADRAEDKRGAARKGMSLPDYENTGEDQLADARGQAKANRRAAGRAGPAAQTGAPGEHTFAHRRPNVG